jgi:hypothetical protein
MQGISPEDLVGYQPFPNNPPEVSPQQSEFQDTVTSQEEGSTYLESFRIIYDSVEAFRIPPGYERRILRLNSSGELVVDISGIPTGPHTGLEAENPLWTTDIFRSPPLMV